MSLHCCWDYRLGVCDKTLLCCCWEVWEVVAFWGWKRFRTMRPFLEDLPHWCCWLGIFVVWFLKFHFPWFGMLFCPLTGLVSRRVHLAILCLLIKCDLIISRVYDSQTYSLIELTLCDDAPRYKNTVLCVAWSNIFFDHVELRMVRRKLKVCQLLHHLSFLFQSLNKIFKIFKSMPFQTIIKFNRLS